MCFFQFNCCCQNRKRNCNENAYDKCHEHDNRHEDCRCKKHEHENDYNQHNKVCKFYKCVTLCCGNCYYRDDDKKDDCKEKWDYNGRDYNFWEI